MAKDDERKVKEILAKFDPELVAVAVKGEDVKVEVIAEEVSKIRSALKGFDQKAVAKAVSDYVSMGNVAVYCGGPVCTCPEGGGCAAIIKCGSYGLRGDVDRSMREIEHLGVSQVTAMRDLDDNRGASAVLAVGDKLGYTALCWDTVRCSGKSIYVMSMCMASLYAFDIGSEVINPVDAILAVAKTSPVLYKRVTAMIKEMEKAGELPG